MAVPFILRDTRVSLWTGTSQPSTAIQYVADIQIAASKKNWQLIELINGNTKFVGSAGRTEIQIAFHWTEDATLRAILNTTDDVSAYIVWYNSDKNLTQGLCNLSCTGGKIMGWEISVSPDDYAIINVNYLCSTFTLA